MAAVEMPCGGWGIGVAIGILRLHKRWRFASALVPLRMTELKRLETKI